MDLRTKEALQRGALAGLAGGAPQVVLAKLQRLGTALVYGRGPEGGRLERLHR